MKSNLRRFLSLMLAFVMILSNVPVQAFAEDGGSDCAHDIKLVSSTATCTEAGVQTTTCENCGEVLGTAEVEATGHAFTEGKCTCGEVDPNYTPSGFEDVIPDEGADSEEEESSEEESSEEEETSGETGDATCTMTEGCELVAGHPGDCTGAGLYADTVIDTVEELQAALNAGGNVTLGGDINTTAYLTVPAGKTVILDLNGYTLTDSTSGGIATSGNLTVKDSSVNKTGKIITQKDSAALYCESTGVLTIESGSFHCEGTAAVNGTTGGTITINGGTFTSGGEECICKDAKVATQHREYPTLTITGGTFSKKVYATSITGGTFTGSVQTRDASGNSTKGITGGTFIGNVSDYVAEGYECKQNGSNWVVTAASTAAPELPTATVTEIENEDLTFAMNFKADEISEEQLAYYGDWYADFELTVNKAVTLNANGGQAGYLSGQYDEWSENWVNVPFENVTLKANEPLKIMAYAAEQMDKDGLKLTYNDVVNGVKDFDCGVFFEEAFLKANPDLKVTLELKMYNPADETESYVIGETYTFTAEDAAAPELPTATVTEIENEDLTFAMNFKADEISEEQLAYYGDWYADFELTVNKAVTLNANGGQAGYLSGQYDEWSENWVNVPFENVTLKANESLKIMEYAAKAMNQSGLKVTYNDIATFVKDFDCGVFFTPAFLKANPDLKVTLELKMYNNNDETENYVIGDTYIFTIPALPTATVTEIENEDLTFAMNFKADEITDAQLAYYGDWYADFELTVNQEVTLNANGGADGYLSGQYDEWSENWVNVPFEDVTLNADETLKIMEYASKLMGQPGLKYTYKEVYENVKDFDCGMFLDPNFLYDLEEDLEITLELKMYNPDDETDNYVIGETYTFKVPVAPELPTATATEIENEDLTFAMNFKADEITDAQLAYYGDWYADFELTVNQEVTLNANGGADGYLSGQYDAWSKNWVNVPFENVTLKANEPLKIMEYASELMGEPGLKYTYGEVYNVVKDFDCGMFFEPEFLAKNPDLVVTLELKMYNPADESLAFVIGDTYKFYASVAQNVQTGTYYNDVNVAMGEAEKGQTVILLKDAETVLFAVYPDVTFDLNGNALTAKFVTSYGDIVDNSEDNSGLLKVDTEVFLAQKGNKQLPVNTPDGYQFVEIIKFNHSYLEADKKYVFQPLFEEYAHDLLRAGQSVSGVDIQVNVSWVNSKGESRNQSFGYNDEAFLLGYLNSYKPATGKYGKMFTLIFKNITADLTYQVRVISDNGIIFASESTVVPGEKEDNSSTTTANQTITAEADKASALVLEGTKLAENATAESLSLTVDEITGEANITLNENEVQRSVDVHIEGIAADNTVPMIITLMEFADKGLNEGNLSLYHVENGNTNAMTQVFTLAEVDAHNEFYYDPVTGDVTMALATFSEIAVVSDTTKAWNGGVDHSWYVGKSSPYTIANADQLWSFSQIVGGMAKNDDDNAIAQDSFSGKTVKLIADINLGDDEENNNPDLIFYPIGYNSDDGKYEKTNVAVSTGFYAFMGTFDGNGHTISNFYHNTWEMKGDHNWYDAKLQYYRDGMGLFGKVYGGTVKNLTVKNFSSDGEIATTGVIAAYADGATFENISVFNCNPRVYNIGNGGIVGCVGWYAKEADLKTTFKNITVDNSNKISALWGTYDAACGGIVGQYYCTSGQSSAGKPKNAGVHFDNCHISAQMDVNNDVCGNYQYYAYRYTGMLIGSVSENETINGHVYPKMDGITAKDCTVHFGTWNDYYYCEFEANGHPSYSGPDDYKFSRVPHSDLKFTDSNGNGVIDTKEERDSVSGCKHNHTDAENNRAIYLPFKNLVTGYGWGVTTKVVGELDGVTILDREEGNSVEKFEGKVTELANGTEIKLSDIFNFVDNGVELVPGALTVAVTNLDENNPVSAEFKRDENNWENGTITFIGTGKVKLTIQDYYFCTPTTIEVEIVAKKDDKFKLVDNQIEMIAGGKTITVDKLFAALENVNISSADVVVSGDGVTHTPNATDWTLGELKFAEVTQETTVTLTIKDAETTEPVEAMITVIVPKDTFTTKFEHTDDFLYRIGNKNEVTLSSLFMLNEGMNAEDLANVTVEVKNSNDEVLDVYTAGTGAWDSGKINFTTKHEGFTGPITVTITDDLSEEYTLNLEVVTATNHEKTTAPSATGSSVVLLNDVSGTFSVSGGHTVYGNGFEVTLPTTYQAGYTAGFVGYVYMSGGNLDNIRIVGPVYPEMNIYQKQAQNSETQKEEYFYNSILINAGNNTISNSYISGSRTAVCLRGANSVVIENTTLSGGAVANMQIEGANEVILRNLTTVQKDEIDSYGKGVTAHGMGVLVGCGAEITIEGELNQYNWLSYSQWQAIVGSYESSFPYFYTTDKYAKYQHTRNDETHVNIAFIFATDWNKDKLNIDNQSNSALYEKMDGVTVSGYDGGVYSVANQSTVTDEMYNAPAYESEKFNPVAPVFNFDNSANHDDDDESNAADAYCVYDEQTGILSIGVTSDSKTIDLSGVTVTKDGETLAHTAYLNGTKISGDSVTIKATDGTTQSLIFKVTSTEVGYDKDGNPIAGSVEYSWPVKVEVATLSYPAPVWNMNNTYNFSAKDSQCYYVYSSKSTGYAEAVPIFNGIKVNYYNRDGEHVELDLSNRAAIPHSETQAIKQDFTVTLDDGSTLTMNATGSYKSGVTSLYFTTYNNKVYAYPSDLKTNSWVRPSTTGYDFNITFTYQFTDPNGLSTEKISVNWYSAKTDNVGKTESATEFDSAHYPSDDCLTEGTLITMADGTQMAVEDLTVGDMVLTFNHVSGKIEPAPIIFNNHADQPAEEYDVLYLEFANGEEVKTVDSHGFFDMTLMQYVYIDYENYADYIGHEFYYAGNDGTSAEKVVLKNAYINTETVRIFCPVSYFHMNSIANGFLNTPNIPGDITGLVNYFEYDPDLKYNEEAMQRDIEKYGLYSYDDFKDYISEEAYNSSPSVYLKVAVGKGMITFEEILAVIDYLLAGSLIH